MYFNNKEVLRIKVIFRGNGYLNLVTAQTCVGYRRPPQSLLLNINMDSWLTALRLRSVPTSGSCIFLN